MVGPDSIRRLFRERYLDRHESYLKSIADLLAQTTSTPSLLVESFLQAESTTAYFSELKKNAKCDEERSLRNLRNAWYHEAAFYYPAEEQERMKFAPWKVVQFYYATYAMLSAMVRCINNEHSIRQVHAIDTFTDHFLKAPLIGSNFFPFPLCCYYFGNKVWPAPSSVCRWKYGLKNKVPGVEKCLASTAGKSARAVSLFHYFKDLREWANYEDSYIFLNLYGPSVRMNLNFSLEKILEAFSSCGEVFLIGYYGWPKIKEEFDRFADPMVHALKIEPDVLKSRFEQYSKSLTSSGSD
jgi:hypothetical protein